MYWLALQGLAAVSSLSVLGTLLFSFRSGVQALNVHAQVQKLGRNHNATLRTLGVLYFLLV